MAALFGNDNDGRREPKSLVEFRAGKMKLSGSTVTADLRKGLVYMKQEERLMHFCWKDRKSGDVVDDLIIFPGEVEFKRIAQCKTGRVYLLKFRNRPVRKYFYWMQEPKESLDEDLQKKVNDLITNPPDPSQALTEGLGGGLQSIMSGHNSLQSLLAGAHSNPQLLEQLIGSGALSPLQPRMFEEMGQSGGTRETSGVRARSGGSGSGGASERESGSSTTRQQATSRSSHPLQSQHHLHTMPPHISMPPHHVVQLGDLQNILSAMNIPPTESRSQEDTLKLTEVVTSDVLRPLSGDPAVHAQVESHLPPTSEGMETILTSPQFQQALGTFGSALQSGQLGPLMTQFGLSGQVATSANTGDLEGFAKALQNELGGPEVHKGGGTESDAKASEEDGKKEDKGELPPDEDPGEKKD